MKSTLFLFFRFLDFYSRLIIAREDVFGNSPRVRVLILLRLLILLGKKCPKNSAVYAGFKTCLLFTPPHLAVHSPPFSCLLPPISVTGTFLPFSWFFGFILFYTNFLPENLLAFFSWFGRGEVYSKTWQIKQFVL